MNYTTINLQTEQFKQNLYALINNSGLPIVNVLLIFKQTGLELEGIYRQTLKEEQEEANKKKAQELENQEENN